MVDTDVVGCRCRGVGRVRQARLIALLGVGAGLLAGCGEDSRRDARPAGSEAGRQSSVARTSAAATAAPATETVRAPAGVDAAIATPGFPGPVGVGFGSVWVAGHRNGGVHRIDPETQRVTATIEVPDTLCGDFAFGFGAVWAPNCGQGGVSWIYRIDPQDNRVTGRRPGSTPVVAAGSLWVVDDEGPAVLRMDPESGRVQARIRKLGLDTSLPVVAIGAADGAVWVYSDGGAVAPDRDRDERGHGRHPASRGAHVRLCGHGFLYEPVRVRERPGVAPEDEPVRAGPVGRDAGVLRERHRESGRGSASDRRPDAPIG